MKELLKAKSEFRKKGVVLIADAQKQGGGGSWRFASEDNLIKTIQAPLVECGLEVVATLDYLPELSTNVIKVTLYHVDSGESIKSTISMPDVIPKKDKNGNSMYLDAEIERAKTFGYLSRILTIRILGLSDLENPEMEQKDLTQKADPTKNLTSPPQGQQMTKDPIVEDKSKKAETQEGILTKEILKIYKDADAENKVKVSGVMAKHKGWREYQLDKLVELKSEIVDALGV